jgi:hypothetical protein
MSQVLIENVKRNILDTLRTEINGNALRYSILSTESSINHLIESLNSLIYEKIEFGTNSNGLPYAIVGISQILEEDIVK